MPCTGQTQKPRVFSTSANTPACEMWCSQAMTDDVFVKSSSKRGTANSAGHKRQVEAVETARVPVLNKLSANVNKQIAAPTPDNRSHAVCCQACALCRSHRQSGIRIQLAVLCDGADCALLPTYNAEWRVTAALSSVILFSVALRSVVPGWQLVEPVVCCSAPVDQWVSHAFVQRGAHHARSRRGAG